MTSGSGETHRDVHARVRPLGTGLRKAGRQRSVEGASAGAAPQQLLGQSAKKLIQGASRCSHQGSPAVREIDFAHGRRKRGSQDWNVLATHVNVLCPRKHQVRAQGRRAGCRQKDRQVCPWCLPASRPPATSEAQLKESHPAECSTSSSPGRPNGATTWSSCPLCAACACRIRPARGGPSQPDYRRDGFILVHVAITRCLDRSPSSSDSR